MCDYTVANDDLQLLIKCITLPVHVYSSYALIGNVIEIMRMLLSVGVG